MHFYVLGTFAKSHPLANVISQLSTLKVLFLYSDLLLKGLVSLSLQHAKMALFFIEYLLLIPFHYKIGDHELKDRVRAGYYVFQNMLFHIGWIT